ncbi:unnamed protein product [Diabrotica balteata]|uniref:C2H2-type domain-containing protein n=1 Tax=Diabrotica balteata TaxID=107213 RepID=A0A9N9X676_DIABA|nr:unnamed protein product [Diabrotica balteata]
MDSSTTICPVCTLFLRPGITLKQHLTSHPKQKVIEALVKLASVEEQPKIQNPPVPSSPQQTHPGTSQANSSILNQSWNQPTPVQLGPPPNVTPVHGNHVFIYQQSMSTTSPQGNVLQVNPLSQQYLYHPPIYNPQMMPYVYQQQQVILSSNSLHPPQMRALPFELPNVPPPPEGIIVEDDDENKKEEDSEVNKESIDLTSKEETRVEEEEENVQLEPSKKNAVSEVKTVEDFESEQAELNDIPPDEYVDSAGEEDCAPEEENIESKDFVDSPHSHHSEWKTDSELSKACQTQNAPSNSPLPLIEPQEPVPEHRRNFVEMGQTEYFYLNPQNNHYQENFHTPTTSNVSVAYTTHKEPENYEQSEPIYTSANILHGNDHMDFVNLDDIVIIGDFTTNPVASHVENFENPIHDRPTTLMTIGEIQEQPKVDYESHRKVDDYEHPKIDYEHPKIDYEHHKIDYTEHTKIDYDHPINDYEHPKIDYAEHRDLEESMSRGSSHVNIRSDERMPARGELSGQESLGGSSDITWNRLQYQECNSRMSHPYEMIGRESWDASDSESFDTPSLKRQNVTQVSCEPNDYDNDVPTIISYTGPPLNFKCSTCGEDFATSKDRKEHEMEKHPEKSKRNVIGSEIGKKTVRKLVIKAKTTKTKSEPNFDNVFTNKLKLENPVELKSDAIVVEASVKVDDPIEITDIKMICPLCDCVLDSAKSLKKHRLEVHKQSNLTRHKCLTCGDIFQNEYKYTEHLKIHPLECRLCGKLFYRKQNIKLHMKRHLGLKPYKCDICEKSFITRQKHDEHKNIHTGEAPINCNFCDEKFRRHSNLVQHRNRHHFMLKKKVKDYICQCGEVFHSKKKLAWHKEIHDSKPKACTHCSEKFLHMSSLTRHMRRAHNDKFLPEETRQNENVECPICKGVYLRSSLDVHIKNHSGTRPYTCLMCNKDFTTKWNLKLHKWTHANRNSKPFKCDQCKGAFIRESDYTAHMNSHKSVRPYTCNYCGAQFIRKYNCLRHVKEHENDKTFNCTVCGKSFHRSYYLKDHMRVHSGVRPYTCHICGKTSTTKSNHNKHVQIHHAREPVSTEN